MASVVRDNKTISELQAEEDYEWQDGDDSALYNSGYEDGINYAIGIINGVLEQKELDRVPASWTIKLIKHTLQSQD